MTDSQDQHETHRFVAHENSARDGAGHFVLFMTLHSYLVWFLPLMLIAVPVVSSMLTPGSWWVALIFLIAAFVILYFRTARRIERTLARSFPVGSEATMTFGEQGYWHTAPNASGFVKYSEYSSIGRSGEWVYLRHPEQSIWRIVPKALIPDAEFVRFRRAPGAR
jgi:membrane protein implicated in regulation of membrane protease activity